MNADGEHGRLLQTKKADVATWVDDPSPKVREFTKRYVHALDQRIAAEQSSSEERHELRKLDWDIDTAL
jgi:hypothetical protein